GDERGAARHAPVPGGILNTSRTSRRIVATVLAACIAHPGAAGAVCQVPLAVGVNAGNANVLLLLDNSGSMNEALESGAYAPNTHHTGNFTRTSTYRITPSGTYAPSHFNGAWPSTPTAFLIASDVGEAGQYSGNYLNWVYFSATAAQRTAIPVVTRIQAAK